MPRRLALPLAGAGARLRVCGKRECGAEARECSYYVFCYRSLGVRLRTAQHLSSWFKRLVEWAAANEVRAAEGCIRTSVGGC